MDRHSFKFVCFLTVIVLNYLGGHASRSTYSFLMGTDSQLQKSLNLPLWKLWDNLRKIEKASIFLTGPPVSPQRNSSKCLNDIAYTLKNVKSQWALKMMDSFGKPQSGMLEGSYKWIGNYDECIAVRASNPDSPTVGNFRGKYCTLVWSVTALVPSIPVSFETGICIPDSCTEDDIREQLLQLLRTAGVSDIVEPDSVFEGHAVRCQRTDRPLSTAAIVVISLLGAICALVVLASSVTAVRYFKKDSKPAHQAFLQRSHDNEGSLGSWENVLKCFCAFTNGSKLLHSFQEGELLCLHGIRFISMAWVILGHTYMYSLVAPNNLVGLQSLIDNFPFQIILQGFFSVDTFFVLSGFLLTYLTMKYFSMNEGKLPWAYFYVHRYLRLTPAYMMVLAFYATVYNFLGSGPYWLDRDVDPYCRDNWWENLLYINNFYPETQCMRWAWYLAVDTQYFVISPIFLISLWRWPIIGYSLLAAFMCVSCITSFLITYKYDLVNGLVSLVNNGPILDPAPFHAKYDEYFTEWYFKPYTRIGPYLVGIFLGYFLFKRGESNKKKHSLMFLCLGWAIATTTSLAAIYGMYHQHPNRITAGIYNAFNRNVFAAGLSWVIYVCLIGQGGFVNRILSYKLFIPLSRLTYCAYLVHAVVLLGYYASLKAPLEFSHPTIVTLYLGFLVFTYCLAFVITLTLESPMIALEKLTRKAFAK